MKPLPTFHCFRIFILDIVFVYKIIEIVQYFTFCDIYVINDNIDSRR